MMIATDTFSSDVPIGLQEFAGENPLPFREPHRRTRRWVAMADLSRRPRSYPQLDAGDQARRRGIRQGRGFAPARRRRREGAGYCGWRELTDWRGQDGAQEGELNGHGLPLARVGA